MSSALIWTLSAILVYKVAGTHILEGNITYGGDIITSKGVQPYWCETEVKVPLISWEELCPGACEDVQVSACSDRKIVFTGKIDKDDFASGVVLSFPEKEYISRGCPPPPRMREDGKKDQVVFRKIISVRFKPNRVTLITTFISGAEVVPHVHIHVGERGPSTARMIGMRKNVPGGNATQLTTTSRVGTVGFEGLEESGSIVLSETTGTTLDWNVAFTGGICELDFDRLPPSVSWTTRLEATAEASFKTLLDFSQESSGELLSFGVPGASFSEDIFLVGTIEIGLFVKLEYETSIAIAASADLQFRASSVLAHQFSLDLSDVDLETVERDLTFEIGSANSTGPPSAEAELTGSVGLRPVLEVKADLPILSEATIDIGATLGLEANVMASTEAYPAISESNTIGVCDQCHILQGSLDATGTKFGGNIDVPGIDTDFFTLEDEFARISLGTVCLFETTCPA